jgi:hypothetical protein
VPKTSLAGFNGVVAAGDREEMDRGWIRGVNRKAPQTEGLTTLDKAKEEKDGYTVLFRLRSQEIKKTS